MLNASIFVTTDVKELKHLAQAHCKLQPIKVNRFKLFLRGLLLDDVPVEGHQGKPQTATFTTIARYLEQQHLLEHSAILLPSNAS